MSTTQAVRAHFEAHPGEEFDNAQLREALDIDDGQAISVALNQMFNNGEIRREKKDGMGYVYWMGSRSAGPKKAAAPVPVETAVAALEKVLAPRAAAGPGVRGTPTRTRSAQAGPAPADRPDPDAAGVLFSVRSDGMLAIDAEGQIVALRREDVRRLQVFLDTVAPLWKTEA